MKLKCLTLPDLEQVRQWRNEQLESLRTPFYLTKEQQEQFHKTVICNRQANARFWGIWERYDFIGMVGLENMQWESRLAEISLLISPDYADKSEEALSLLLHEGFMNMNLVNIYTEVYACSPYRKFWLEQAVKYGCIISVLPCRKYYNNTYWPSHYINFNKGDYLENTVSESAQTPN
jgi:hypothetical protein